MGPSHEISRQWVSLLKPVAGVRPTLSDFTPEARAERAAERPSRFADVLQQASQDRYTTTPSDDERFARQILKT